MTDHVKFWNVLCRSAVISAFLLMLGIGSWAAPVRETAGDPEFWTAITGSSNDGFDVYAKNTEEASKSCTVEIKVTLDDGSTKSYKYSSTVRKTDKMWVGGEAGLKPGPVKSVEITSSSCS